MLPCQFLQWLQRPVSAWPLTLSGSMEVNWLWVYVSGGRGIVKLREIDRSRTC